MLSTSDTEPSFCKRRHGAILFSRIKFFFFFFQTLGLTAVSIWREGIMFSLTLPFHCEQQLLLLCLLSSNQYCIQTLPGFSHNWIWRLLSTKRQVAIVQIFSVAYSQRVLLFTSGILNFPCYTGPFVFCFNPVIILFLF